MVSYDLGWSANEGLTRIDVLVTNQPRRKTFFYDRFVIDIVEVIDGEPGPEEFELKVALLSRHLACWSPAILLVPTCWGTGFPRVELVKLDKPQSPRADSGAMAWGLAPAPAGSYAHVLAFLISHSVGARHNQTRAGNGYGQDSWRLTLASSKSPVSRSFQLLAGPCGMG